MARRFFFHYNKPASAKRGHPVLSVHFKNSCLLVKGVDCERPIQSKINKTQPRCVMQGMANSVEVKDDIAFIR